MGYLARIAAVIAAISSIAAFEVALAQSAPPQQPLQVEPLGPRPSLDEVSKTSERLMASVEMTRSLVQHMLDKAIEKGDAIKIDCVDEKLNVVDKRLQLGREAKRRVEETLRRSDGEQASINLQVLTTHHRETQKARSEAELCIGADPDLRADSRVNIVIDPNLPDESSDPPFILIGPGSRVPELPPSSPDL